MKVTIGSALNAVWWTGFGAGILGLVQYHFPRQPESLPSVQYSQVGGLDGKVQSKVCSMTKAEFDPWPRLQVGTQTFSYERDLFPQGSSPERFFYRVERYGHRIQVTESIGSQNLLIHLHDSTLGYQEHTVHKSNLASFAQGPQIPDGFKGFDLKYTLLQREAFGNPDFKKCIDKAQS